MVISRKNQNQIKRVVFSTILLIVISLLLTSCGSGSKNVQDYSNSSPSKFTNYDESYEYDTMEPSMSEEKGGIGENSSNADPIKVPDIISQRKIIMDGNVSLETLDFEESIATLDRLINDFNGFAEVRNVTGKSKNSTKQRTASYVIRIPAESFDLALKNMGNVGTVLESNSKGTDITDQYVDSETRIKTLKVQEDTLLQIMSKATELSDVITLEARIAEIRYEIESLENKIKNYDRLVAFSRINIFIQEVDDKTETKPDPETFWDRISNSFNGAIEEFRTGVEDFLVWLVGAWISLIFFLILVAITIIFIKRYNRRCARNKEMENKESQSEEKKS